MSFSSNLSNNDLSIQYFFSSQSVDVLAQLNAGSRFIEMHYFQYDSSPVYFITVGVFGIGASNAFTLNDAFSVTDSFIAANTK